MQKVRYRVAIMSGKGGVGKSSVCAQLAWTLAAVQGLRVGVLDIDICGPSMPKMMGVEGEPVHPSNYGWCPVFADEDLCVISIGFLLDSDDAAVIWQGGKKDGMILQFLKDVDWPELDVLLIDTPPGTSDEHMALMHHLKNHLDGVIMVTTPQEVALADVRKEFNFLKKVQVPVIGVVENMNGFHCPSCKVCNRRSRNIIATLIFFVKQKDSVIFPVTSGGATRLCENLNVPLLCSMPLDPRLLQCCENGQAIVEVHPESPISELYEQLATKTMNHLLSLKRP